MNVLERAATLDSPPVGRRSVAEPPLAWAMPHDIDLRVVDVRPPMSCNDIGSPTDCSRYRVGNTFCQWRNNACRTQEEAGYSALHFSKRAAHSDERSHHRTAAATRSLRLLILHVASSRAQSRHRIFSNLMAIGHEAPLTQGSDRVCRRLRAPILASALPCRLTAMKCYPKCYQKLGEVMLRACSRRSSEILQ